MQIRSLLLLILPFFLLACQADSKFSKAELEEQDAAWDAMMKVHDDVMPLQVKDIPDVIEELEVLAQAAMVEASDFHPRAQEAIADLNAAYEGMNVWMDTIGSNQRPVLRTSDADHTKIMTFITEQTDFISKVAEDMTSSIAAGRALIATRK